MRVPPLLTLSALAVLAVSPTYAQNSRGQDSLNSTSDRLATQSQLRGIQEQQTFDNNQTRMQIQRNEISRPVPPTTIIAPRR